MRFGDLAAQHEMGIFIILKMNRMVLQKIQLDLAALLTINVSERYWTRAAGLHDWFQCCGLRIGVCEKVRESVKMH